MRLRRAIALHGVAVALLVSGSLAGSTAAAAKNCFSSAAAFHDSQTVSIAGYAGDAMEPFLSHDARYLFFNNRNEKPANTDLFYAERFDDLHFVFRGAVRGVNTAALEAVASLDSRGEFYFVSDRDYDATLNTLFHGRFADGAVTGIAPVAGVSVHIPGHVNFDAEISPDGDTLYYVDGVLAGGPSSAVILIAKRTAGGFVPVPDAAAIMANINTAARQYAPSVSPDGRELFFTRIDRYIFSPTVETYRSTRPDTAQAFGRPSLVAAITGFSEAPALSPDGCALYYHSAENDRFIIKRVVRE